MPEHDYTPDVADVAALIRARTKVAGGNDEGTFTENTRPTADQVTTLIGTAQRAVRGRLKGVDPCSAELADDAKAVVALRAAMMVEASYFPEQTRTDRSNFAQLRQMYDDDVTALAEAVGRVCGTTPPGGDDEGAAGQSPAHHFDDALIIGRSSPTHW